MVTILTPCSPVILRALTLGLQQKNLPLNHQAGVKELGKSVPEHKVRNGEHFEGGRLIASNKTNLTHVIVIMIAQNIDQPSEA